MSRGGRGGRYERRGVTKIGGVEISYDEDIYLNDRPQPTPLFPEYHVPQAKALSLAEQRHISHFRALRHRIHEGPLYTVLDESARISKAGSGATTAASRFNAFEGMPTYSDKYTKKTRKMPKLDTRPYLLKFFPRELWKTLDPTHAGLGGQSSSTATRKAAKASPDDGTGNQGAVGEGGDLAALGEDEEERGSNDDEAFEEDVDDEYDTDDEPDDYNGEGYFKTGDEDKPDDMDAGEADGENF